MALIIGTTSIAAKKHYDEGSLGDSGEEVVHRSSMRDAVKQALCASYDLASIDSRPNRPYKISVHAHFPAPANLSVRLFGSEAYTESIAIVAPATPSSSRQAVLQESSRHHTLSIEAEERDVGARIVAVEISGNVSAGFYIRSIEVDLGEPTELELSLAHGGADTATATDEISATDHTSPVQSPCASTLSVPGRSEPEVVHGRGRTLSSVDLSDDELQHGVSKYHAPIYRTFVSDMDFAAVYYAHPRIGDLPITSTSLPVHAMVTKRKKDRNLFQIKCKSGKHQWSLWASVEMLQRADEQIRIMQPKTLVRKFPREQDFVDPQRAIARLDAWLQDVCGVASTAHSPLLYGVLRVPPRFMRKPSRSDEDTPVVALIYRQFFGGNESVPPGEARTAVYKLFDPIISKSKLDELTPDDITKELHASDMLSRQRFEDIVVRLVDAWSEDCNRDGGGVSLKNVQDQLTRQYGIAKSIRKRFLHKHFDRALRMADRDATGELDEGEVLDLLWNYLRHATA